MKPLIAVFIFLSLAAADQRYTIPRIEPGTVNAKNAGEKWSITRKLDLEALPANIYSFRYDRAGRLAVVSTDDYTIHGVDLGSGKILWTHRERMYREREFDGALIFDLSPDGSEFLSQSVKNDTASAARYLTIRRTSDGSLIRAFPEEQSKFFSPRADMDHRYPGDKKAAEHLEANLGPFWIMAVNGARYVDDGATLMVWFSHNMTGGNLYDHRVVFFDRMTGARKREIQMVADPKTGDFSQPAGFKIGSFGFPHEYSSKRKTFYYGTAHGRIHELNEQAMSANNAAVEVEKKSPGKVIAIPLSDSDEMAEKDSQSIRQLVLSPDQSVLFAVAGYENHLIQLYAYRLSDYREVLHTGILKINSVFPMDDETMIMAGTPHCIIDPGRGKISYWPEGRGLAGANFVVNPEYREIVIVDGTELIFLHPAGGRTRWKR